MIDLTVASKTIEHCKQKKAASIWKTLNNITLYEADMYMCDIIVIAIHPHYFYTCRMILENGTAWLTDNIINAAQMLLKKQYGVPGFQSTIL